MPYRLINKLQKLMTMEFESQPDTNLTSGAAELSEDIYDIVDEIAAEARLMFGSTLRPNLRQEYLMQEAGFPVKAAKMDMVCWRVGQINTPRGIVLYY